ncbi:hypothetical protein M441DRAFT_141722 [Trichoderma asperellum CBS 433.97]|uniref:Uncharacterized protein n=1 Tax=Trichoderma asperellum (strain ATCC 204424 / CBS 433.97 / NBRC 101777) TaxID=1042311 RepID=A0A2T3Z6L7_TRIA4|nr:hypothetical protein M441DRAFT_141722 [Trichoderma asperellum CBS 433.97]PTB40442.1 hypothetical protein M441DRAFT_141722 [Trichoderma asperellum CBS 433.97]
MTPKTAGRSTRPYDRGFQQHLIDYGILPHAYEFPDGRLPSEPGNKEDILRALAQPRASLSPSHFLSHDFRKFQRVEAQAMKERDITTSVVPIIEGILEIKSVSPVRFANLDHLTDGTLVPGSPDIYYGARPEQLHPQIRKSLQGCVVPSTQNDLPVAPNFFVEIKGKDGSAAVAQRQLFYDMSLGERGQQALRSRNPVYSSYDNEAHTVGCTYADGQLKIFACHANLSPMPGGQIGFVMTQLRAFALSNDVDTFRQGAAAYRNSRDLAMKQRNEQLGNQMREYAGMKSLRSVQPICCCGSSAFGPQLHRNCSGGIDILGYSWECQKDPVQQHDDK